MSLFALSIVSCFMSYCYDVRADSQDYRLLYWHVCLCMLCQLYLAIIGGP